MHPLGSPFVRDQLSLRAFPLNPRRIQPEGELVLYWMEATHRLEENWALRYATLEADRLGRPLLIVQELSADGEYASDRSHRFVLEGAREIARRAAGLGLAYRFTLRRRRSETRRAIDVLSRRACLVVTDLFPTEPALAHVQAIADRAHCRVVAVDSVGVVPAASFPREEYAARTIRPKLDKIVELSLEPVEDRPPRRSPTPALLASLDVDWLDLERADLAGEIARCEIDHAIRPAPARGGMSAARARLAAFVADGLAGYSERRRDPSDDGGSSRLSPYLHFGHISAAEVTRTVRAAGETAEMAAFLNEMLTWRELALNFCLRNPKHRTLEALPDWVHRSMQRHAADARESTYSLEQLDRAETADELWNAGQRELVQTGQMHNVVRMLWGKAMITWTPSYADALAHLIHLNDKYALDGRDPNSYAGIQWCFGKFDRPFAARPVWGTIRPMSLERARRKPGMESYVRRWSD